MDKESYQPMTIGHVASEGQKRNKIKRKRVFFSIWLERAVGGGGENHIFRERSFNFSLDFPAFGPSVLVGAKRKVVLRCKGYA